MKSIVLRAAPVLLFAAAAASAGSPGIVGLPVGVLPGALFDEFEEIPVGDLVRGPGNSAAPVPDSISWPSPSGGGGYMLPVEQEPPGSRQNPLEPEYLAEYVNALAGDEGGSLVVDGELLLVPTPRAAAVKAALARIRAQRPGPVDLEYVLETSSGGGAWKTLLSGREPVLVGERRVFADARDRSYLGDFDVELAQASEIPDPIVHIQRTGAVVVLRVLPLPLGNVAVLDVDAMVAEPLLLDPIMLPSHADMAPLDRAAVARDQVRVVFLIEPGKSAEQSWTGRDGRTVRLRAVARWTPPPADAGPGAVFWAPVVSEYLSTLRHVGYQMRPAGAEVDENWPAFGRREQNVLATPDRVKNRFKQRDARWLPLSQGGLTVIGGKDAGAARDALVAGLLRELRSPRVEVVVRVVAQGDGKVEGASEIFRAAGSCAVGLNACYLGSEARAFLQDADVEVAQASKIIDPMIGVLTIGTFCNVRTVPGIDGNPAQLDLDIQLSRLEAMEEGLIPVVRTAIGEVFTGSVQTDKGQRDITLQAPAKGPPPPKTSYRIEMPQCREVRIAGLYPLGPEGKVVLRRSAPGFLGEGKEIVVEATVK